jgi:hypothetical protein
VWRALHEHYQPRLVVIEYNAHWPPGQARAVAYQPWFVWDGTDYFGASLAALHRLAEHKGYRLVYCDEHGVNAFMVRADLIPALHYRPPNYDGRGHGHPPSSRTMVHVGDP